MDCRGIVIMKPEFPNPRISSKLLFDSLADGGAVFLLHLKHQQQVLVFTVTGVNIGSPQGNCDGFPKVFHGGI